MNRTLLTRIEFLWMREGVRGIARHLFRRPSLRQKFIIRHALRTGHGLEIEPGDGALALKAQGFHVETLGHTDSTHEKKPIDSADMTTVEQADHSWHGEPLSVAIGQMSCYDWIIASHVIEKTPDFVGFLIECESLLRTNGKLILVIPDKRHCFDHFQSLTSTGDVLDALSHRRTRPPPGRVFDCHANAVRKGNGANSWRRFAPGRLRLAHSMEQASHAWQRALNGENFIDVHNWYFTPHSFSLLIEDLRTLDLIGLSIADGPASFGGEFCVCLQRGEQLPIDRLLRLAECFD